MDEGAQQSDAQEQAERPTFNFALHSDKAAAAFREVRGRYENLVDVAKRILNGALSAREITVHSVEGRAKSLESFAGIEFAHVQCHQCSCMHGRLHSPAGNRQAYRGQNTTFLNG
ncbi:hypothetical protein PQR66_25915 [Paraburkholderia agricolaris]|jgi:hypothetical protein|uniref:Uncharacterized protein n=1 Tax=Paraburkholderia agricolaris TaxID=2152888 RepID=A0ABW8ZTJ4_9BURK